MALPTIEKTWLMTKLNQTAVSATATTFNPTLLLAIKNAMVGYASNPWTVRYSSGKSNGGAMTAGTAGDGVDRWTVFGDLGTFPTSGSHGWMVLRNVDGVEILIDCLDTLGAGYCGHLTVKISLLDHFTGGTTSTAPTATDSQTIKSDSAAWFGGQSGTVANNRWHMWHSTDGTITRFIGFKSGVPHTFFTVEKLKNPAAGHTIPYMYKWVSGDDATTNRITRPLWCASGSFAGRISSTNLSLNMCILGRDTAVANSVFGEAYGQVADETDGNDIMLEIPVWCQTTNHRGPKGLMYDCWWGQRPPATLGDTYPLLPSPTRTHVLVSDVVLPCDGNVFQTS